VLRPADEASLKQEGLVYTVTQDPDGFLAVVIESFPMPVGLEPQTTAVLVRLPPGFPDAAPDMFYCDPPVHLSSGGVVPGTEAQWTDPRGRVWQRWSRHLQGQWRPGIDNLATYLAYIRRCNDIASGRAA
jgi:hypothetical protein